MCENAIDNATPQAIIILRGGCPPAPERIVEVPILNEETRGLVVESPDGGRDIRADVIRLQASAGQHVDAFLFESGAFQQARAPRRNPSPPFLSGT